MRASRCFIHSSCDKQSRILLQFLLQFHRLNLVSFFVVTQVQLPCGQFQVPKIGIEVRSLEVLRDRYRSLNFADILPLRIRAIVDELNIYMPPDQPPVPSVRSRQRCRGDRIADRPWRYDKRRTSACSHYSPQSLPHNRLASSDWPGI